MLEASAQRAGGGRRRQRRAPRSAEGQHAEVLSGHGPPPPRPARGGARARPPAGKAELSRPLPEALYHGQRRVDIGARHVGLAGEQADDLERPGPRRPDGIAELQVAALGEAAVHERLGRARPGRRPATMENRACSSSGSGSGRPQRRKGIGSASSTNGARRKSWRGPRPPARAPRGAVRGRRRRASWCSCRRRSDIAARIAPASGSIAPPGARRWCG